jgi:hypothetical protein
MSSQRLDPSDRARSSRSSERRKRRPGQIADWLDKTLAGATTAPLMIIAIPRPLATIRGMRVASRMALGGVRQGACRAPFSGQPPPAKAELRSPRLGECPSPCGASRKVRSNLSGVNRVALPDPGSVIHGQVSEAYSSRQGPNEEWPIQDGAGG